MDITSVGIHGWREALKADAGVLAENRQDYFVKWGA